MELRSRRLILVLLVTVSVLAPLAVWPATAVSITCAPATGFANANDGGWILTNSGLTQRFDAGWNDSEPTVMTGAQGITRGPDGSLWVLTATQVFRLNEDLDRQTNITIRASVSNGSTPKDLVYVGQWLLLYDDRALAYDERWENGTRFPELSEQLPDETSGMTATGETLAVVTQDGTIHVYDPPDSGSIVRRRSISANISDEAVDVYRDSNDTWLILEPYNATRITDDGERIEQHSIFFSCADSGGLNALLAMFGFAAIGILMFLGIGVVLGLIFLGVLITVRHVRR